MIYYTLIKTFRWSMLLIFAAGLLYAGIANAADFDQIELPFKGVVHTALGLAIVFHFGILLYFGARAKEIFLRLYLDDQWRKRQHEYDDVADIKIYYNNPEGKPSITKRLR
jgi:hypothetical protein